jgi:hypothetical protein
MDWTRLGIWQHGPNDRSKAVVILSSPRCMHADRQTRLVLVKQKLVAALDRFSSQLLLTGCCLNVISPAFFVGLEIVFLILGVGRHSCKSVRVRGSKVVRGEALH